MNSGEATVRGYLEAFATGDPERIASFVTPGFVNDHTAALGSGCVGKDEYLGRLPGFLASMPELRYEVESVLAHRSTAWVAYTLHAEVNGGPIAVRGAMHFELDGQRIARRTDYWDSLVFQQQAGLI
ncbi:MAG: nuclear transport factor 2 family protein [Planctomycetales bacterium]|nr:nuclear transport factor 2 family protein [Planctomycetales bacterium]